MSSSKKVLIVDDEREFLEELELLITDRDPAIEVATTTDAREGLELVKKNKYTLLISDLNMPGFSGKDFLAEVKNLDKSKKPDKILVVSGLFNFDRESKFSSITTIPKPWDELTFSNYLSYALGDVEEEDDMGESLINEEQSSGVYSGEHFASFVSTFFVDFMKDQFNTSLEVADVYGVEKQNIGNLEVIDVVLPAGNCSITISFDNVMIQSLADQNKLKSSLVCAEDYIHALKFVVNAFISESVIKLKNQSINCQFSNEQEFNYLTFPQRVQYIFEGGNGRILIGLFIDEQLQKKAG